MTRLDKPHEECDTATTDATADKLMLPSRISLSVGLSVVAVVSEERS